MHCLVQALPALGSFAVALSKNLQLPANRAPPQGGALFVSVDQALESGQRIEQDRDAIFAVSCGSCHGALSHQETRAINFRSNLRADIPAICVDEAVPFFVAPLCLRAQPPVARPGGQLATL